MTNTQILIKTIREIMRQRGFKQCAVSERAGFSPEVFSKLLTGRKVITAEYIPLIAKALEVSINELYGGAAPSVAIGNAKYSEIVVMDCDNNLIASITADSIIENKECRVVCVPAVN